MVNGEPNKQTFIDVGPSKWCDCGLCLVFFYSPLSSHSLINIIGVGFCIRFIYVDYANKMKGIVI